MKAILCAMAALVLAGALGSSSGVASPRHALSPETLENLGAALRAETFAQVQYRMFARHAHLTGQVELAQAFERAAEVDRTQTINEEADLAGVVGRDAENLRTAIEAESYEADSMYAQFAQQAREAGDGEVAAHFERIRQRELKHCEALKALLAARESATAGTGGSGP